MFLVAVQRLRKRKAAPFNSQTVSSQNYSINYSGLNLNSIGLVGVGIVAPLLEPQSFITKPPPPGMLKVPINKTYLFSLGEMMKCLQKNGKKLSKYASLLEVFHNKGVLENICYFL